MKKTVLTNCIVLFGLLFCLPSPSCSLFCLPSCSQKIFLEDFESCIYDNCWADNGIWQVGTPSVGPSGCHSGSNCAGTLLDGYPDTDSRIITPSISLPGISGENEIHLTFWHWFDFGPSIGEGRGVVQISIYDENESLWSNWETISSNFKDYSVVWTKTDVDVSRYSGKKIRFAFCYTHSNVYWSFYAGWYIDDIEICVLAWGDMDGDGKTGLAEAIHALQVTAGIK